MEYLDYNVDWDGATQKVTIAKDETTLNLIIGDTQATRDIIYKGNTHSYKNPLEVAPQIINDSTYIPLSDVAKAFALNITWDSDNREVHITQYKKGDLTPLIEFGIISDDDLNKGEYITTQEALNAIKNFQHYNVDDFKNLYIYDYLKSFDNISDESKILLSVLERTVLTLDDIININLEGNLTNLQALTYVGRLTGISYSSDSDNVYDRSEPNEIYDYAYQNNLIENKDTSNAQSPITREDFYDLLNKVLFCNHYAVTIWQDVQIMTILITIPNRQLFPKKYLRKLNLTMICLLNGLCLKILTEKSSQNFLHIHQTSNARVFTKTA
mgnify:CR=1 FL=1